MHTTSENKNPDDKQPTSAVKKVAAAITAKKNRGLVIAAIVGVLGAIGVFMATGQDGNDDASNEPSQPTVEIEDPADTGESPPPAEEEEDDREEESPTETEDSEDTDRPVVTEEPTAEDEQLGEDAPDPADYPPGNPEERGGLPDEFPLSDSYTYANTESENDKQVINGTVSDSAEAIQVLELNVSQDYRVTARNVDRNKISGRWNVEGPGMPSGTVVVITADGMMQVRIPEG